MSNVLRKIRKGKVKVNGRWFEPDTLGGKWAIPYDGRLDGQIWLFGTYDNTQPALLALWGSKEKYEASKDYDPDDPDNPYYQLCYKEMNIIDGVVQWYFWREIIDPSL